MTKLKVITLATCLILSVSLVSKAEALFIVDTGVPTGNTASQLNSSQWFAAEFELLGSQTITGLQTWIQSVEGTLTAAIYGDGGSIPDSGNEIFSQSFSAVTGGPSFGWQGLSGLNLDLGPGEYWLAFEIRDGQTYDGLAQLNPPNPVENEAFFRDINNQWLVSSEDRGIRIEGPDQAVIPEPMTMVTLGFSLLGGAALRRKRLTV